MSGTELHLGKLIPIEQKETLEATAKYHLEAIGVNEKDIGDYTTSWLQYMHDEMSNFGHVYNGVLYRIDDKEMDPNSLAEAQINDDGTINYQLLYYNGGGSFSEALDVALEKIQPPQTFYGITLFTYDDPDSNLELSRCHAEEIVRKSKDRVVHVQSNLVTHTIDLDWVVGIADAFNCGPHGLTCNLKILNTPMGNIIHQVIAEYGISSITLSVALVAIRDINGVVCDDNLQLIGINLQQGTHNE